MANAETHTLPTGYPPEKEYSQSHIPDGIFLAWKLISGNDIDSDDITPTQDPPLHETPLSWALQSPSQQHPWAVSHKTQLGPG